MDQRQISLKSLSRFTSALISVPPGLHKGQRGRIAVVGGSEEYTGAPYFAAISAQRVGADLSHVFCHPSASTPIKSYSPDLIVQPLFTNTFESKDEQEFLEKLQKMDVVVLGPGCGTSDTMQRVMKTVIEETRKRGMVLVCDADVFRTKPEVFATLLGHDRCVLTPNIRELSLMESLLSSMPNTTKSDRSTKDTAHHQNGHLKVYRSGPSGELSESEHEVIKRAVDVAIQMHGPVVFLKGVDDVITDGSLAILSSFGGANRRCGGQGDVLAGTVAALLGFLDSSERRLAQEKERDNTLTGTFLGNRVSVCSLDKNEQSDDPISGKLLCAAIASAAVRLCAKHTEEESQGYMVTSDMIRLIGREVRSLPKTFELLHKDKK